MSKAPSIEHSVLNDDINQHGAIFFISEKDITRNVREIEKVLKKNF